MDKNLKTKNLILKVAHIDLAENITKYYLRNKIFLEKFEPQRKSEFFEKEYQLSILKTEIEKYKSKNAFKFYIVTKKNPEKIIGMIVIDNIIRGAFLSCFLGYKLDEGSLNKGYMTQAVFEITKYAFEKLKLHRIEANVMPHNKASLRVLVKCGYINEGFSKKYLRINGIWEDHIHMVIINDLL